MPRVSSSATLLRGLAGAGERASTRPAWVLRAGRVDQGAQLVELEEAALRLGHADAHPLAAGRVALDVAVLDRVVEDRREHVDQLAERRRAERNAAPVALVAQVRAGGDRGAQLAGLAHLVGLERKAQLGVDLVEARAPKNGSRWLRRRQR